MYQDGNVRLAPLPPPGVDWIPFGSSLIVGHSDPADLRPAAPVTSVTFFPSTLRLHVRYRDGGSARLALSSSQTETELAVTDIRHGRGRAGEGEGEARRRLLPFATFRSMYIEDGNSDCDSVLVDGGEGWGKGGGRHHPILSAWGTLHGRSFFFYRRCESSHLTLSPDLRVDVKKVRGWGPGGQPGSWWWQLYSQANRHSQRHDEGNRYRPAVGRVFSGVASTSPAPPQPAAGHQP